MYTEPVTFMVSSKLSPNIVEPEAKLSVIYETDELIMYC
jgi:hypothetical protein